MGEPLPGTQDHPRWTVIRTGQAHAPYLTQWTLFNGVGPPSNNHPSSIDEELMHLLCDLINQYEKRP